MNKTAIAVLALAASCGVGYALGAGAIPDPSTLNPATLKFMVPANIPWKGSDAVQTAVLYGDPAKPGFYVQMIKWMPGHFSMPHYHPNDRQIMVLSGTWWVGTGTNYDPENATVPMKTGTLVTHFARGVHYDGNRAGSTEPAIELIWGMGPAPSIQCQGKDAETGPGPCEDARKTAAAH